MELLKLKEVEKSYNKIPILQNVNITIEEGDFYGIIGESGSGKTTLLNMITGFIPPTAGAIEFHSQVTQEVKDLNLFHHHIKKFIGFTPQHNAFYPKLTIKENLIHFGKLYKLNQQTLITNIKSLLQFTKLYDHRNKLAEHLSEGMKRRLDIACSLVHKPRLLVLDEPTADLDPILQNEILFLLQEANRQGITIIMASHHLDSVENYCNKVAIVRKGTVDHHGLIDDIKRPFLKEHFTINLRPGAANRELIINSLQQLAVKKIVDKGSQLVIYPVDIEKTVSSLLQFIKEENLYINDLDVRKPSLNEIFERMSALK